MKKRFICLILSVGMAFSTAVSSFAATNSILLFVDNERVNYISCEPIFINGSIYAPVDETLMLMGFTSRYIKNNTWLRITKDKYAFCVYLPTGAFYEGEYVTADAVPIENMTIVKKNGEYYIPIRNFCDLTGFTVVWDANNRDVYLYSDEIIPLGSTNEKEMLILDDFVKKDCTDYVWKYNRAVAYYVPKIQSAIKTNASNYSIYAQINEFQAELRRIPTPRGACSALSVETIDYLEAVKYALTYDYDKLSNMSKRKALMEESAKIIAFQYGKIRDFNISLI